MHGVSLREIANITGGIIRQGDPTVKFTGISTDTRKLLPGSLFIALRGEKYDARQFLEQAIVAGAAGFIVDRPVELPGNNLPVLEVADTLLGLQNLAAWNRAQCNAPLVGVTGSAGKTSTKDVLASVLGARLRTIKTPGNFNNEIGLPLTLLQMDEKCEIAVVEMGMRGIGQIDSLCRIAKPTVAVITNIGEAHIELLGSIENIAKAKGEILDHIPADGFAVLPAADPLIHKEAERCRGKMIYFGLESDCDVFAKNIRADKKGNRFTVEAGGMEEDYFLPMPGRHNVLNALAAIAVSREIGLSPAEIRQGLFNAVITQMRSEILEYGEITVINDSYNANPASVKAALQFLQEVSAGRKMVAVLGDMLELGDRGVTGHKEVGAEAALTGVDRLVTVGERAANIAEGAKDSGMPGKNIFPCAGKGEAIETLRKTMQPGDVVLVKGSRSMGMEQIVEWIAAQRGLYANSDY